MSEMHWRNPWRVGDMFAFVWVYENPKVNDSTEDSAGNIISDDRSVDIRRVASIFFEI